MTKSDLDSISDLYDFILKFSNLCGSSRLNYNKKDPTNKVQLHRHWWKHVLAYFGLWSTVSITVLIFAQIVHATYTKGFKLQDPAFMLHLLFAIINSALIRVQYEFIIRAKNTATVLSTLFRFVDAYQHRNNCTLQFPVRTIKYLLVSVLLVEALSILGSILNCELFVGSLLPVCPTQRQIPIVDWIWTHFPIIGSMYLYFNVVYVINHFYCTLLQGNFLLLMTGFGIQNVLTLNLSRTIDSHKPNSHSSLKIWAREQLQAKVICSIYNEALDPLKVFAVILLACYDILLAYALIKVKYDVTMTLYMAMGGTGLTIVLAMFSRLIYRAHDVSAQELEFRKRQAPAMAKYWKSYVRACSPWQVNLGRFCRNYTRESNIVLWRTAVDNLMNLLLTF